MRYKYKNNTKIVHNGETSKQGVPLTILGLYVTPNADFQWQPETRKTDLFQVTKFLKSYYDG